MNNPPSPYSDANWPGQAGQGQESEMLYSYPDAAGFPQPDYPPTLPMDTHLPTDYANVQPTEYAGYADIQRPDYAVARTSWNALWIALTALVLLLLVAGGSVYYYLQMRSTPAKTLQAYCTAIKNDDGQALYDTYSSNAQTQTDEAHLQQGLRLIEFLSGGIADCAVDTDSISENDPQANARVTFILDNGRMSSAILHLIDENGQWKVENNAIFP